MTPQCHQPARRQPTGGLMAGITVVLALLTISCGGPAMELWHAEKLTAEFGAGDIDQIKSFDDYRQLEDRLFAQLEDNVVAHVPIGVGYELFRYSSGSTSDPQIRDPNWNRSFELPADAPAGGVLLLHGMSDSPYSLKALGQCLNEKGAWVLGLRLPGHGTIPSGLVRITWEDMSSAVRIAMRHMGRKVGDKPLFIIG